MTAQPLAPVIPCSTNWAGSRAGFSPLLPPGMYVHRLTRSRSTASHAAPGQAGPGIGGRRQREAPCQHRQHQHRRALPHITHLTQHSSHNAGPLSFLLHIALLGFLCLAVAQVEYRVGEVDDALVV